MAEFPAGRWKVAGWGVGVGDFPEPVEVDWAGEADNVYHAFLRARRSESWRIYAPISITTAQRIPPRPPNVEASACPST